MRFLIILLLMPCSVMAQTNQVLDLFRAGDTAEYHAVDATGTDPGPEGTGVTWDFSGLTRIPSEDYSLRVDVPGPSTNHEEFPGTELITTRVEDDAVSTDYLQKRGGRFFVLGSTTNTVGTFHFSGLSFFPGFPLVYGETRSNIIAASYRFEGNLGTTGTSTMQGEASAIYDGFGTLILPDGTQLENIQRVRLVREWHEVSNFEGTTLNTDQIQVRYHYMDGEHSAPVFEWVNTHQEVTPEGGDTTQQTTLSAAYRHSKTNNPMLSAKRGTHLTLQGGSFDSQIIVNNPTDEQVGLTLQPLDETGGTLPEVNLDLAPGETTRQLAQTLFGEAARSFYGTGCPSCVFSLGYRANTEQAATAQVHQSQDFRTSFTFYPGEWDSVFDGQALINTGTAASQITASQIDENGQVVDTQVLEEALPPGGKHLSIINQLFEDRPNSLIQLDADGPMSAMVLRISTDGRFLYQNNPLPAGIDAYNERWLAHITSETGGFTSEILVHNLADEAGTVNLQTLGPEGQTLGSVNVTVPANSTERFLKTERLHPDTSHLFVTGSPQCIVSVGYRALLPGASTAVIHEAAPVGTTFKLYPGEWDLLFDGVALINTGDASTNITLTQIDDNGQAGTPVTIASDLAPRAKFLGLLEQHVADQPDSVLLIEATQPLALLSLRLTKDNLFLYNNDIIPR